MLWVVAVTFSALSPQESAASRTARRREVLYGGLSAATLGSFATALAIFDTRSRSGMLDQLELYSDDSQTALELQQLRSSNQLWPARRELEGQWRALREHPADLAQTAEAYTTVLRVRAAIGLAEDLARDQRWAELDRVLPLQLVREFEAACTVLSLSAALSADARAAIGFQWGACGWKRCGAQAAMAIKSSLTGLSHSHTLSTPFWNAPPAALLSSPPPSRPALHLEVFHFASSLGGRCSGHLQAPCQRWHDRPHRGSVLS